MTATTIPGLFGARQHGVRYVKGLMRGGAKERHRQLLSVSKHLYACDAPVRGRTEPARTRCAKAEARCLNCQAC